MTGYALCFDGDDMASFADGSHDTSPLHVDPAFGRRSPYGRCIVYGGLLSIGMLGALPAGSLEGIRSIRSTFSAPVLPGERSIVEVEAHPARPGAWELRLLGRGRLLARLVAESRSDGARAAATLGRRDAASGTAGAAVEAAATGLGPYSVGPELERLARKLGASTLHPALLEGIAWASYAVGMGMPDFQGVCAAVDVTTAGADVPPAGRAAAAWIHVRDHDARTGRRLLEGLLADSAGETRTTIQVEALAVSPPLAPDPVAAGIGAVPPEPRGTVVVIGGSRGFGAAASLALVARGYTVHAVYAASVTVAEQLRSLAGPLGDRLVLHRADARDPDALAELARLLQDGGTPLAGLVLAAGSPPLAMGLTGDSGGVLADYVGESLRPAAVPLGALLPLLEPDGGWILVSSAAALASPLRHLPQLTAAKGALEGLARWVAATAPGLRIAALRAPELRTGDPAASESGASSAELVAAWTVEQLAGGSLAPGLTILEPEPAPGGAP